MRKALTRIIWAGAFLVTFATQAGIFDTTSFYDPKISSVCLQSAGLSMRQYTQNSMDTTLANGNFGTCTGSATLNCSSTPTFYSYDETANANGYNCSGKLLYQYQTWNVNSNGVSYNYLTTYQQATGNGFYGDGETCPPDEHLGHVYSVVDGDGNMQCYDPAELAEADTCEGLVDNNFHISKDPAIGCVVLDDGSKCPARSGFEIESNYPGSTPTYFYTTDLDADPTTCYTSEDGPTSEGTGTIPQPEGYCENIGGKVLMCNESESAICTDGVCPTGCGNVDFGEGSQFICIDDDTDSDGVPNYSDIDIDGDGIRNEDDEDWDGDGQNDTAYTGSGGGGGGGASAGEIKNVLTEQGDFSSDQFEANVDGKVNALNMQVDTLLESDTLKFQDAIEQNSLSSNLDVSSVFTSGCNATFSIPFSTEHIDICEAANKANPFLYVIFALSTFIFCTRQIINTVRGTD